MKSDKILLFSHQYRARAYWSKSVDDYSSLQLATTKIELFSHLDKCNISVFKVFVMLEHRKVVAGAAQAEWESEKGELRFTKMIPIQRPLILILMIK